MRAIIPAAGMGRRLHAQDSELPKAMYMLGDKPLLALVLDIVGFIKPEDIYIVVGYKKDTIISYFGDAYHYIEQKEQLGTGHAIRMCEEAFRDYDGTVLVAYGDMPLFRRGMVKEMCDYHERLHADCTLMTAQNEQLKLWARITRDENGRFKRIVEGKDCSPEQARIAELFAGILAFNSKSLFSVLPDVGCDNVQHEHYLTEVPELMAQRGMRVETILTDDGDDLRGVNTPEDLAICKEVYEKRNAVQHAPSAG